MPRSGTSGICLVAPVKVLRWVVFQQALYSMSYLSIIHGCGCQTLTYVACETMQRSLVPGSFRGYKSVQDPRSQQRRGPQTELHIWGNIRFLVGAEFSL